MSTGSLSTRETITGELREVSFSFSRANETVPGLLVLPAEDEGPFPLVLIQHPGMSSKDEYFVRDVAIAWAKRGWACGGIDAPLHGDRDTHDPMALFRDPSRYPAIAASFAADVSETIDRLADRFAIDQRRIGYVGYSLGSMLGISAVGLDGRFKAAALCLVGEGGLAGPATTPDSPVRGMKNVAVRVLGKLNDELIPRAATQSLFDALPGKKDLVWLPGGHFEIGPDVIRAAGEWLKAEL